MNIETCIAAFRSRAQTLKLLQIAKANGIPCRIINTPKGVAVGCGLSVSFDPEYYPYVRDIVRRGTFDLLAGFFIVTRMGNRTAVKRI